MIAVLQFGSAVCAFMAAAFWFQSAYPSAAEMSYEGISLLTQSLNKASRLNRLAAGFSGISAGLAGIATLYGIV
jgi:hypothetical protein